jgi:hypothetical protein
MTQPNQATQINDRHCNHVIEMSKKDNFGEVSSSVQLYVFHQIGDRGSRNLINGFQRFNEILDQATVTPTLESKDVE